MSYKSTPINLGLASLFFVTGCAGKQTTPPASQPAESTVAADPGGEAAEKKPDQTDDSAKKEYTEVKLDVVKPTKTPQPVFPKEAKSFGTEAKCLVRFWINTEGKPSKLVVKNPDECPEVFYPALNEALMRWEFQPVKDESGNNVAAKFVLRVVFKLTN